MDENYLNDAVEIFECSNHNFLISNQLLFDNRVSERTLCGALMIELHECIDKEFYRYQNYYVDVEYNRAKNGTVKHCIKTIKGFDEKKSRINCDLIVHGRGNIQVPKENFIAVEMKKSTRSRNEKDSDRDRLKALTSLDNVYPWKGNSDPSIVCGYVLGIYYEINYKKEMIKIEYYNQGELIKKYELPFKL